MKLPRDLSARSLAAALCRDWGYVQVHQTGSDIILQTEEPGHHRIAIPAHPALRIGMLHAILRDIAAHKGIHREDILRSV